MKLTRKCNSLTTPHCLSSNKIMNVKTSTCTSRHRLQFSGNLKTIVWNKTARLQSSKMLVKMLAQIVVKMLAWLLKLKLHHVWGRILSTKNQFVKMSIRVHIRRKSHSVKQTALWSGLYPWTIACIEYRGSSIRNDKSTIPRSSRTSVVDKWQTNVWESKVVLWPKNKHFRSSDYRKRNYLTIRTFKNCCHNWLLIQFSSTP